MMLEIRECFHMLHQFLTADSILIRHCSAWLWLWLRAFFEETIFRGVTIPLGIIFTVAVFVISGIWSLYLIRPAMRDKIQTLWNEKWGIE